MKLSDLKINPSNPRTIKDARFKKLCDSIRDFPKMMAIRPIVIDRANGNLILGGNMRYLALKKLGMAEVPDQWVRDTTELTEEEKRRFIAVDNLDFGSWDFDILANSFDASELLEWGFDEKELGVLNGDDSNNGIVPERDPNILIRLSVHPGMWLGKRQEILSVLEKMKQSYNLDFKVEE
jgi:hypothetical protein